MENQNKKIQLVPAICTQCGAQLEVDPKAEAAVCKYCKTPFIVEKAINNYTVQHATIEHADNVTVDMSGTVKETLDFVGKQMDESRKTRRENRNINAENERLFITTFFKYFFIFATVITILWLLIFGISQ